MSWWTMTQIEAISHWLWSAIIKCNKNWTNTIDINRGEKEVEKKNISKNVNQKIIGKVFYQKTNEESN